MKESAYSISADKTKEERIAFKTLLKEKKELEQKDMSGEWMCIIKGPPLGSENPETQSKTTLNNLSVNSCNVSVMHTGGDSLINKRSELLTIISADNPDIICIPKTIPKHTHLPLNECELQANDYCFFDCFSNITNLNCHRSVVIYVKKKISMREVFV